MTCRQQDKPAIIQFNESIAFNKKQYVLRVINSQQEM